MICHLPTILAAVTQAQHKPEYAHVSVVGLACEVQKLPYLEMPCAFRQTLKTGRTVSTLLVFF